MYNLYSKLKYSRRFSRNRNKNKPKLKSTYHKPHPPKRHKYPLYNMTIHYKNYKNNPNSKKYITNN